MGEAGGAPLLPPIALTDEVTALAGAFSVMAALRHAERTGEGQWQSSGASMPRLRGF